MPEPESDPTPLSRIELLRLAQSLGVSDADVMTRAELRAAIESARAPAPAPREQPTTWLSVARRLLASVIERGLNLPDAAALIRGDTRLMAPPKAPPPVATVTLARIYAAQGHLDRAIGTLDEVLTSDPDHELARDLRAQLELRRQESLARDADAAARARRVESELTPRLPAVAPRGDAARGTPSAAAAPVPPAAIADSVAPVTAADPIEPVAAAAPAEPVAAAAPESAPSEPAPWSAPGELMAPAFAVAERAEAGPRPAPAQPEPRGPAANAPAPPPSASSELAGPESEAPVTLAATPAPLAQGAPSAPEAAPAAPGLLLIEAEQRARYLYWELGSAGSGYCWVHVVSHAPAAAGGTERRERRFLVQQRRGAVRLEGFPREAVVRAKLSQDPDGEPLAIASAVRSRDAAVAVEYSALPGARLEAIARRAEPVLARATPLYWEL